MHLYSTHAFILYISAFILCLPFYIRMYKFFYTLYWISVTLVLHAILKHTNIRILPNIGYFPHRIEKFSDTFYPILFSFN